MTRPEILDTAKKCVCGEREQDYGTPEDNFRTIAELWTAYYGQDFNAIDVAIFLSLVKISRIASGHAKSDNWVDLAGYAACGGEIEGGTETTTSDKPVEPWVLEDTMRKKRLFCLTMGCDHCPFNPKGNSPGAISCGEWCRAHPAEARHIMDEWEAEHGVD